MIQKGEGYVIKIMLVDDESIEREGLQLMLSRNRTNFEIVAEARFRSSRTSIET